jgi:hypothetical protein
VNEELVNQDASEVAHAALRGAVGAMAMSGMRTFTKNMGLLKETPPEAIAKKRRPTGIVRLVPKRRRAAFVTLFHWAVGAGGGVAFGLLPDRVRNQPWAGPVHGILVLIPYELVVSPALGLGHWNRRDTSEHVSLIVDHLLYGFVLSQFRRGPADKP